MDGWLVQPSLNLLTREQGSVRLRPQLVDLLLCLASEPGKVFDRNKLVAQVWSGRYIAESAISRCIAELRSALGDDARQPRVIETIIKRGYRLIAVVEWVSPGGVPPRSVPTNAHASDEPRLSLWRRLAQAVTLMAVTAAAGTPFRH